MRVSVPRAAFAAWSLVLACGAAGAAVLDFETPGQYSGNFRAWAGSGLGYTVTQTDLGAANDYVVADRGTAGTSTGLVALYDTTPANTADAWNTFDGTITVSWDVMANFGNTSFAVFFINPTTSGTDKNVMSILNVTASGTSETVRYFVNNPLNGSAAGTQVGTTQTQNIATQGVFGNMSVSYTPATGMLRTVMGTVDYSFAVSAADRAAIGTAPGVALRVNDTDTGTSAAYFDNVSVVPEPGLVGLLALSGLAVTRRRNA